MFGHLTEEARNDRAFLDDCEVEEYLIRRAFHVRPQHEQDEEDRAYLERVDYQPTGRGRREPVL